MICITHRLIAIDDEITASELLASWRDGCYTHVLNKLSADHAGLTALFFAVAIEEGSLTVGDRNEITNGLVDRRRELLLSEG